MLELGASRAPSHPPCEDAVSLHSSACPHPARHTSSGSTFQTCLGLNHSQHLLPLPWPKPSLPRVQVASYLASYAQPCPLSLSIVSTVVPALNSPGPASWTRAPCQLLPSGALAIPNRATRGQPAFQTEPRFLGWTPVACPCEGRRIQVLQMWERPEESKPGSLAPGSRLSGATRIREVLAEGYPGLSCYRGVGRFSSWPERGRGGPWAVGADVGRKTHSETRKIA
ncbi:PREDICTED: uncharacterized protein LOC102025560 [Chinchilla lanigera]|uniref:uncharacterized protein LOC102025560 n=1 Tax=Chinchilla lanigera TaxID=34839 RepID=UPI00038EA85B|nr:PREDICTED: uncharacterized protein LOC102025560 [Chinchilla lanigera]